MSGLIPPFADYGGQVTVSEREEENSFKSDVPEFPELGGAEVPPRKPKVSEDGPRHTVLRFGGFYLGGQGTRLVRAIFRATWLAQHKKAIKAVRDSPGNGRPPSCRHGSRLFGNSSDLSSSRDFVRERTAHDLHISGVTP